MRIFFVPKGWRIFLLALFLFTFSSCLTANKLDKYVAKQYNNELPKLGKKKRQEIDVMQANTPSTAISTTIHKTDKFLPLLVYWKYDHRQSCSLNPTIAVTQFTNTVNAVANKSFTDKLAGRKLELTVEQAPAAFSIVAKEQMIWLIYAVSWSKIYIEPDAKDLVVSYKLTDTGSASKTGTITVKNTDKNKGIRLFQSWKSATSEYLMEYNANLTNLTKSFVTQLANEL
jgi:hypothetical protein